MIKFSDDMETLRAEDERLGKLIAALMRFEDSFASPEATKLRQKLRDDRYLLNRAIAEGKSVEFLFNGKYEYRAPPKPAHSKACIGSGEANEKVEGYPPDPPRGDKRRKWG